MLKNAETIGVSDSDIGRRNRDEVAMYFKRTPLTPNHWLLDTVLPEAYIESGRCSTSWSVNPKVTGSGASRGMPRSRGVRRYPFPEAKA